jgi:hypothetical protein
MVASTTADMPSTVSDPTNERIARIVEQARAHMGIEPERWARISDRTLDTLEQVAAERSESDNDPAIEYRLATLRADAEARKRLAAEKAAAAPQPPPIVRLDEFLAQADDDTPDRIDDVLPMHGNVMLAAQFKAGKTTVRDNLTRSLADGIDFLGRYKVNETCSNMVIFDNELSKNMARRWLRDQGIVNTSAVHIVCMRGKLSTFNPLDDTNRAQWAERLRGADYVKFDCLRPALDALGLDEHKDAGRFLLAWDELMADAGVRDSAIVHHMGHTGERARGDSRLQDWPDVTWKLVRESDDPASPRYFSAYGRDIDVPESLLTYDHATRRLTIHEGERRRKKNANGGTDTTPEFELVGEIVDVLVAERAAGHAGPSEAALLKLVRGRREASDAKIKKAIDRTTRNGYIKTRVGARNARHHEIHQPCTACGWPLAAADAHQAILGCDMKKVATTAADVFLQ